MKRSEIINVIEEYLWHTEHLNIPCSLGSDFKSTAEEIIVLIENAGMLRLTEVEREEFEALEEIE